LTKQQNDVQLYKDTIIQSIKDTKESHGLNTLAGKIRVDFRSSEPIYLQIARQIEQLVAAGELQVGDQLPTVRELATELRINFNTVTRAYKVLDEARLISTQRGRGTYVWEEPSPETIQILRQEGLKEIFRRSIQEAVRMGFSKAEIDEVFHSEITGWENSMETDDIGSKSLDKQR
jgi:GntR family transcriptional regulator